MHLPDLFGGITAGLVFHVDHQAESLGEQQARGRRQQREVGNARDHQIGAQPFRLDAVDPHALGNQRHLLFRDDRELARVADLLALFIDVGETHTAGTREAGMALSGKPFIGHSDGAGSRSTGNIVLVTPCLRHDQKPADFSGKRNLFKNRHGTPR